MNPAIDVISGEGVVTAMLTYSVDTGEQPASERYGPANTRRRTTGTFEERSVPVANGRLSAAALSLERNGFVFVKHRTAVKDFFDQEQIESVYYPELESLVTQVSGASRTVVYDLVVRSGDEGEREARLAREPVRCVHNDYTVTSGHHRVRELLPGLIPEAAEALLSKRFAVIQVWRPIRTIWSDPLGMLDAGTVDPEDLLLTEHRYPDRVAESYRLKYSPRHRWVYFPLMQPDEVIVFKTFDSATDGRARFAPHAAFTDPTAPVGTQHRLSVEARLFAFFD